jgi:hypothetical protein
MSEQSNETEIALLKKGQSDHEKRLDKIDSNIRYAVLALLGVIIAGITKVFGF